MSLTFGSLFAGVGGFDLGLESSGWECGWQVEWDKACQQVLARHWPDVPRWGDVCDVSGAQVPPVDLITFGSPCQDLSVAGKRAGFAGERSGLFHEAIRIIKEMRDATANRFPRWAIWENVGGALSSNGGADFGVALNALADIGAVVIEWHVLDAQWFGVPQRRRRVFVVACFDSATAVRCGEQIFPVATRSGWHPPSGNQERQIITSALTKSLGSGGPDFAHAAANWMTDVPAISPAVTSKWAKGSGGPAGDECQNLVTAVKARRAADPEDFETWELNRPAPTLNAFDNATETRATVLEFSKVVRRLTCVECERLQGWPDDHTRWRADGSEQSDSARYKQIGNGVASPVAAWVGKHIANVERFNCEP